MLAAGENPRYVGRRLIRMAVEDVGLAAPDILVQAVAAFDAYERLGSPEGELALAQATIALACAPKSNAAYAAYGAALEAARSSGSLPPPLHVRNAPTALMRDLGYGAGYAYDHDAPRRVLRAGLLSGGAGAAPVSTGPPAGGRSAPSANAWRAGRRSGPAAPRPPNRLDAARARLQAAPGAAGRPGALQNGCGRDTVQRFGRRCGLLPEPGEMPT